MKRISMTVSVFGLLSLLLLITGCPDAHTISAPAPDDVEGIWSLVETVGGDGSTDYVPGELVLTIGPERVRITTPDSDELDDCSIDGDTLTVYKYEEDPVEPLVYDYTARYQFSVESHVLQLTTLVSTRNMYGHTTWTPDPDKPVLVFERRLY